MDEKWNGVGESQLWPRANHGPASPPCHAYRVSTSQKLFWYVICSLQ
jgi:hypothetical protein